MATDTSGSWDRLAKSLDELQRDLSRSPATHINTQRLKSSAKALVQLYFRLVRPELEEIGVEGADLEAVDFEMQDLLGLANSRNRKSSYLAILRNLHSLLGELEVTREIRLGAARSSTPAQSAAEVKIAATLRDLVPSAGLSYEQALLDLDDPARLSYRGPANELREALRETLDHLAPDSDVEELSGFKLEKGQTRPSQKQKVRYVLRSRGLSSTARKAPEGAASLVDELTATVTRASYERGNLSTHIATRGSEVRQLKMYVDSVLAELLEIHA